MVRQVTEGISDFIGVHPLSTFADGRCHLIPAFGNMGLFETDEGLVIFDFPIVEYGPKVFKQARELTDKQVKFAIFSHGHFDHAFGFAPFINEIKEKNWKMPEVIAHENCIRRFEKYRMLENYHAWINRMQFASVGGDTKPRSAQETLDPTIILRGNDASYEFELGGVEFKIYHDKGETDDSIWMWIPEKETICTGDLMVSSFPNVGNPYKVQRYPKDWANAMDKMRQKQARYIIPGHGPFIEGKDKVDEILSITSEALNFIHDEVVKRMNQEKWFEQIYHEVLEIYPEKYENHPILRPIYGCPRFAIHATHRLYHGWYDSGNPTDLFPAKSEEIAREFLNITDERNFLEHAEKLFKNDKPQLALHVVDVVINGADPDDIKLLIEAYKLKSDILRVIVKEEPSFIAANIIDNGRLQIKAKIKHLKKELK
ncbi:MAG: MBL fold metallo-hydrolase [Promethearchaeota archaeon]|nr:MAG: MBL fold metallo-hydrolase [Candidatus Lokiarchaeota archaeon]